MQYIGEWFERRLMLSATDHAPVATVTLNTQYPQTGDVLTATATKSDADGDLVGLTFIWRVDGVVRRTFTSATALTDTFDLAAPGNGDTGQTITVEVTPSVAPAVPIALWDFENGTAGATATGSGTIRDSTGAHNGTPIGGPVYRTASSARGVVGLNFDGVNDRVAIPDSPQFALTHSLTLEANIYLDRLAPSFAYNQIVFRGDDRAGYDAYMLGVDSFSGKLVFRIDSPSGASSSISSPAALPLGTWLHVAATLDDATGTQSLYINRERIASSTTTVRPVGSLDASYTPGLGIGDVQSEAYNERFAGTIADVAISNSALTPGQFVLASSGNSTGATAMADAVVTNSAPTAAALSPASIQENRPSDTVIGTFSTLDPDMADTFTYSLMAGPGSADNASFSISSDQLKATASLDFEGRSTYSIRVRTTDSGGLWIEKAFTIAVTDVNDAPVLGSIPGRYINAGNTLTFTAVASDPDLPAQILTYSLLNGPAGATIDPATGLFTWTPSEAQSPDTYTLTIQITDGTLTDSRSFQVILAGPNSAPVLAPVTDQVIPEAQPLSFTVTASDADLPYQTLTYSLATGTPAGVTIDPATGLFTWTPSEAQGPGVYTITVLASDGFDSSSLDFQVTVTEVNSAPTLLNASFSIPENQPTGTLVGTLSATDPDLPANSFTYAITAGDEDGRFAINSATGQITVARLLDYETRSSYSLTVTATDNGSPALSASAVVSISVTDLPEFGLQQGQLQRATLTDSDGDLVTFSLTGGGTGTIQPNHSLTLTGTTAKSVLSIGVKKASTGDGYFSLSGISADGLLKRLSAPKVFVTGDLALNTTSTAAGLSTVTLNLAGIRDGSMNTHDLPITSLKLLSWQDTDATPDQLLAPWIGAIRASGDWQADILTSSSNTGVALKSLKVAGSITQTNLWAAGAIKSLTAKGVIASSRIAAADGLTSLTASALQDSDILVGVPQDFTGRYASTFANPAARLGRLTITGRKLPPGQLHPAYVVNSHLSAPLYGKITLTNVPATTPTPILHVLTDTGTLKLRSLSPEMLPAGTWPATQALRPGQPERPSLVEVLS